MYKIPDRSKKVLSVCDTSDCLVDYPQDMITPTFYPRPHHLSLTPIHIVTPLQVVHSLCIAGFILLVIPLRYIFIALLIMNALYKNKAPYVHEQVEPVREATVYTTPLMLHQ